MFSFDLGLDVVLKFSLLALFTVIYGIALKLTGKPNNLFFSKVVTCLGIITVVYFLNMFMGGVYGLF